MSALPNKLTLSVVTPERELVHEEVDEVQLRAKRGYLGILPGHAPLLTELGMGELRYKQEGRPQYLAIVDGFAEVLPERVIVLAEIGECAGDIDLERAQQALERARKRLSQPAAEIDWDRAAVALARALLRVQVAQRGGAMSDHE
jgi:F-type H+-transporting ATPase subunit epsilon